MKLPFRRRGNRTRGQALVEFALILPILALLTMLALDFGRVFFGWVALNNAARIAANAAAEHPDAWSGSGNGQLQADYRQQVINDMQAINCAPPEGAPWQPVDVPDPVFSNVNPTDTSSPYQFGDQVSVKLDCVFTFLTPLVGNMLGNPFKISAQSQFVVRTGTIAGVPIAGVGCTGGTVPYMIGSSVATARSLWTAAGFSLANFSPASGSDTDIVLTQTTSPASSAGDCLILTASVTVTHSSSSSLCSMPFMIGERVNTAQSDYQAAGFTGNFIVQRPPQGNYTVTTQSLVGPRDYACDTDVRVGG